jgi:hypothetical protein
MQQGTSRVSWRYYGYVKETSRLLWRIYRYVTRKVMCIALLENFSVTKQEMSCYMLNPPFFMSQLS